MPHRGLTAPSSTALPQAGAGRGPTKQSDVAPAGPGGGGGVPPSPSPTHSRWGLTTGGAWGEGGLVVASRRQRPQTKQWSRRTWAANTRLPDSR